MNHIDSKLGNPLTSLQNLQLKNQVKELETAGPARNKAKGEGLPRPPPRFELSGHRNIITAVRLHSTFSLAISTSEGSQAPSPSSFLFLADILKAFALGYVTEPFHSSWGRWVTRDR